MNTTIKTLSDGRTVEAVGDEIRLAGEKVNGLVAREMAAPNGEHTHYIPVGSSGIALTASEERALARHREQMQAAAREDRRAATAARRAAESKHDALYNEGADGYNPNRYDYDGTDSREPTHKEDM